jgi:chromosomal replication initiation ATPase DnaA
MREEKPIMNSQEIFKIICEFYGLDYNPATDPIRKRELVKARQVGHYLSKKLTRESLNQIALHIGRKDHATVLHSCKNIVSMISPMPSTGRIADPILALEIRKIENLIEKRLIHEAVLLDSYYDTIGTMVSYANYQEAI